MRETVYAGEVIHLRQCFVIVPLCTRCGPKERSRKQLKRCGLKLSALWDSVLIALTCIGPRARKPVEGLKALPGPSSPSSCMQGAFNAE